MVPNRSHFGPKNKHKCDENNGLTNKTVAGAVVPISQRLEEQTTNNQESNIKDRWDLKSYLKTFSKRKGSEEVLLEMQTAEFGPYFNRSNPRESTFGINIPPANTKQAFNNPFTRTKSVVRQQRDIEEEKVRLSETSSINSFYKCFEI